MVYRKEGFRAIIKYRYKGTRKKERLLKIGGNYNDREKT